ncbi:MAG: hypothetical protein Q7T18_01840 [Sedimentisphaerales bacterium]|nr:hypothetical protein [Sedimentisphaerales bacterium]
MRKMSDQERLTKRLNSLISVFGKRLSENPPEQQKKALLDWSFLVQKWRNDLFCRAVSIEELVFALKIGLGKMFDIHFLSDPKFNEKVGRATNSLWKLCDELNTKYTNAILRKYKSKFPKIKMRDFVKGYLRRRGR